MPDVSDELLLNWQHQIASGNESAFNQLFRCFYIRLVDFAANILKARPPAEEIVNDVFVKLWQRRQYLPEVQKLKVFSMWPSGTVATIISAPTRFGA